MRSLPRGTVTFLFTDVEGSTRLLHELGAERYAEVLDSHRRVIRQACGDEGGIEVDTQGDAFFFAFAEAGGAARAARAISGRLIEGPMRVRIGLHTGAPLVGGDGYVGEDVHLGARIAAAGHGGQTLLSRATVDAIGEGHEVRELGEHRLKDIAQAVAIFQLGTDAFPPLKTISNTNLPRPADAFFGRGTELADVLDRVRRKQRLITLAGPGGTGKTRLAIEAATSMLGDFKAGVFWVDLVRVRDPDAVATAVGAVLGTEREVGESIGEREMLLVIDNLEHLIAAAPWVGALVRTCPNLAVIVTSRERMRVRGETVVDVPPLAAADSAELFADRAGLPRTGEIDELCANLEHIPLAVELAAARASSLTPRQIIDRLGQRLDLLEGGRDADPRQRTLRATIDWSYGLLETDEQQLLRRLAVFAGGASLAGIEAVCAADLDAVSSLVDKSLVRFDEERYSMLETVRQYAAEQLAASGETDEVRARHAAFISETFTVGIPELIRGGSAELGTSLVAEFADLQVAFAWLVDRGDAAAAARLVDTVWWFLNEFVGQPRAGLAMCQTLLSMPSLADADRVIVRHREGNFAMQLGDPDRARRAWSDAADLAQRIGDLRRASTAIHNLAVMAEDPHAGLRLFERSLELAPAEDERHANILKWNLAGLKRRTGDVAGGDELHAEVLAWAYRVGDHHYIAAGERDAGDRALQRGDAAEALDRATRSRDVGMAQGETPTALIAEMLRCRALLRLDRFDDAAGSLREALLTADQGDLASDVEVAWTLLSAAAELLAAAGEVDLATTIEASVRHVMRGRPEEPGSHRNHDEWLRKHGVTRPAVADSGDLPTSIGLLRNWLSERGSGDQPGGA